MIEPVNTQTLEPQLRRLMRDCRKLYASGAQLMVRRHPTLLEASTDSFAELMEDLHRGLLIKVYTQTIRSDGKWSQMEKYIGALLIEHLWDQHLRGDRLREAADGLLARSDQLSWEALLAPFVRYEPLRDMVGQVETIASRFANLVAKCDGLTTPEETITLHEIRSEISRALRRSSQGSNSHHLGEQDTDFLHSPDERAAHPGWSGGAKQASRAANGSELTAPPTDPEQRLADALAELDELVGLDEVKQRIRSLSNFLLLQRKRHDAGLATMPISLHMAFVGNPGTGKTTVARIVGQILGAMGILHSGHLVETDRSGVVAQYAGQTALKTNTLCDSALGGVLFIDEAYSLVSSNTDDAYGREAIQTLLKRMEDDRDRMVVILAGYPDEMEQMIGTNPGLSSRINTRITFDDYSPADLGRIFESLCNRNDYKLPGESRHRLLIAFDAAFRQRDRQFGNGRLARNAFEDCVRRLADRIAGIVPLTDTLMTHLMPQDIAIPGADPARIETLLKQPHALRVCCPGCDKRLRVRGQSLGQRLRCPSCQHRFAAPWAEVDHDLNNK
jgi:hypothetical protein